MCWSKIQELSEPKTPEHLKEQELLANVVETYEDIKEIVTHMNCHPGSSSIASWALQLQEQLTEMREQLDEMTARLSEKHEWEDGVGSRLAQINVLAAEMDICEIEKEKLGW